METFFSELVKFDLASDQMGLLRAQVLTLLPRYQRALTGNSWTMASVLAQRLVILMCLRRIYMVYLRLQGARIDIISHLIDFLLTGQESSDLGAWYSEEESHQGQDALSHDLEIALPAIDEVPDFADDIWDDVDERSTSLTLSVLYRGWSRCD